MEENMNKYRLRRVDTYEEIHAVRENITYERIYWPESQMFYDYIDIDFETDETFGDGELMVFSDYDEEGASYTYVSLNALSAIYEYERCKSKPFSVMTIDGLHYIKSVIASDDPYELTLICDTRWDRELLEVPATYLSGSLCWHYIIAKSKHS